MNYFAIMAFWALVCYQMANNRKRNAILGAIAGAMFGFFTVIYYWTVGQNKKVN